jgi:coenzyme F420-0:L-glutamate ligase/coenzyme F420-1:gamma-L-glutamate ligase
MRLTAIRTPLLTRGDDLVATILESLRKQKVELKDGDVLAIASKAIAVTEGRVVSRKEISPSADARDLATRYSLEPEFAELVLKEADQIYGGVYRSMLTLKNGILTVNAGVDGKNVPEGSAALWPSNPQRVSDRIRREISRRSGRNVAIVVVDSQVAPLRMGTRGMALAVSGFNPVEDCRGKKDLFQKFLVITRHSIADDLASAAHLLMGETDKRTSVVLIRGAPVTLAERVDGTELKISPNECVYMHTFLRSNET